MTRKMSPWQENSVFFSTGSPNRHLNHPPSSWCSSLTWGSSTLPFLSRPAAWLIAKQLISCFYSQLYWINTAGKQCPWMYTLQAWAGIRLSLHHSAHSLELQVEVEKQMMLHKMDQTFLTLNVFFFFQKTTVTRRGREGESIIGIFQLLRLLVSFCLALSIPAMKSNPVKLRFIL